MTETIMCCTLGHEDVPADHLGTYNDGDTVETNVPYCDACALQVAEFYRVTSPLDVPHPAEAKLAQLQAQLEQLAQDVSDGAWHTGPWQHEQLADRIRGIAAASPLDPTPQH